MLNLPKLDRLPDPNIILQDRAGSHEIEDLVAQFEVDEVALCIAVSLMPKGSEPRLPRHAWIRFGKTNQDRGMLFWEWMNRVMQQTPDDRHVALLLNGFEDDEIVNGFLEEEKAKFSVVRIEEDAVGLQAVLTALECASPASRSTLASVVKNVGKTGQWEVLLSC